ncbi:MAG: amidohydrolase [Marinilabiliales bacterium]|nr:MAG: amidohydrolase [Marinilabiliales bacterium]
MRLLSAHFVIPADGRVIKNGIVHLSDKGEVLKVEAPEKIKEQAKLEFYNGVIVPGFVNVHCHLELSHLWKKISKGRGMVNFIESLQANRNASHEIVEKAIENANNQMIQEGIVLVGDISNSDLSFSIKKRSKIKYHTFVEVFSSDPKQANKVFQRAQVIQNILDDMKLEGNIVPHSPYSVSDNLFTLIKKNIKENQVYCIHNQESKAESDFFLKGEGDFIPFFKKQGIDPGLKESGHSSPIGIMKYLPKKENIIFVHNTYSTREDIQQIRNITENCYWCLCPGSNLYIEKKLPNMDVFTDVLHNVCIGTDSLASNEKLSVLQEMYILQKNLNLKLDSLVEMATINGAKALIKDSRYGSIEEGKKPGVNLIENIDFTNFSLTEKSTVKRLD